MDGVGITPYEQRPNLQQPNIVWTEWGLRRHSQWQHVAHSTSVKPPLEREARAEQYREQTRSKLNVHRGKRPSHTLWP